MSKFNFCYLPSLNLRQDLEDHLLDNNSEFKDCECNSDHVNHRCESVFDKSRYEEISKMSRDEYPDQTKQKKTCRKEEGGNG